MADETDAEMWARRQNLFRRFHDEPDAPGAETGSTIRRNPHEGTGWDVSSTLTSSTD